MSDKLNSKAKELAKLIKDTVDKETNQLKSDFDNIKKTLTDISESLSKREEALVKKVYVENDVEKDVNKLNKDEKFKAFARALFSGDVESLKVLSEGVNADGGYTVPQEFYRRLVIEPGETVRMRNEVTVIPMKTNQLTISKHDTGPEVYWTSEGKSKTTTTADFSQPTITVKKMAAILYLTDELVDDSAFSLVDVMVSKFREKIDEKEEAAIMNGNGTTQPTGIFAAGTISTIAATATGLTYDDIIDLVYSLGKKYRANAKFIIHNNQVRDMRKIKDNDGRYIWVDSVDQKMPATLLGYPVLETYWSPESQIAFGDWKTCYWLGDRQRMTVKITNDTEEAFTKDLTAIRVVQRIGGNVIVPNAARILNNIP